MEYVLKNKLNVRILRIILLLRDRIFYVYLFVRMKKIVEL